MAVSLLGETDPVWLNRGAVADATMASSGRGLALGIAEGPRWRLELSPGVVAIRSSDPARADRSEWVRRERDIATTDERVAFSTYPEGAYCLLVPLSHPGLIGPLRRPVVRGPDGRALSRRLDLHAQPAERRVIAHWSGKSRKHMLDTISALDWSVFADRRLVATTLTYPGPWERFAPSAREVTRQLRALLEAYADEYDERLAGVWKREFQRRGAPHYHILHPEPPRRWIAPRGRRPRAVVVDPEDGSLRHGTTGEAYGRWSRPLRAFFAEEWARIVHESLCQNVMPKGAKHHVAGDDRPGGCDDADFSLHLLAGIGVDYNIGDKLDSPTRIAAYFIKHGQFIAKSYQNEAPALWAEQGSVGRYWGVWGGGKSVAGWASPSEARTIAEEPVTEPGRTYRRTPSAPAAVERAVLSPATALVPLHGDDAEKLRRALAGWHRSRRPMFGREKVDRTTGEVTVKWMRDRRHSRLMVRPGGSLCTDDAPGLLLQAARRPDLSWAQPAERREPRCGAPGLGPIGFLP